MATLIKSLDFLYNDELIITDVDDCLIKSSDSIKKHGFDYKKFYFDKEIFEQNKKNVFYNAELTEWGKDLIKLDKSKIILLTSCSNRLEILIDIFKIDSSKIIEGFLNEEKLKFINNIKEKCIYVDDKLKVINNIKNDFVTSIKYPKLIVSYNFKKNKR